MTSLCTNYFEHSFGATWDIDTSLVYKYDYYKTPAKVVIPDVKWYLCWKKHWEYIDFWFCIETKTMVKFIVKYKFSKSLNCSSDLEKYTENDHNYQLLNIKFDEFIGATPGSTFTIEIDGTLSFHAYDRNALSIRHLVEDNQELGLRLFKDDNSKDSSILVDGKIIKIHKLIFATESPVFARMFEEEKGWIPGWSRMFRISTLINLFNYNFEVAERNQIKITDFKAKFVEAAVDYCYRQDISSLIRTYEDQIQLLLFADKYDFQTLKPKLEKLLSKKLNTLNISMFATAADQSNALELQEACANFICCFLNRRGAYSREQLASFDLKSLMDIYAQAVN